MTTKNKIPKEEKYKEEKSNKKPTNNFPEQKHFAKRS